MCFRLQLRSSTKRRGRTHGALQPAVRRQRVISLARVCNFIQTGDAAICQAEGDSFVPAVATALPTMEITMSIGLILVIILVIFLLGGFSGRFGGYGYGYGHGGMGIIGIVLVVLLILFLLGRI
jgi:hypothetical protein